MKDANKEMNHIASQKSYSWQKKDLRKFMNNHIQKSYRNFNGWIRKIKTHAHDETDRARKRKRKWNPNDNNDNNVITDGRRANEINMKKICLWIDNIIHWDLVKLLFLPFLCFVVAYAICSCIISFFIPFRIVPRGITEHNTHWMGYSSVLYL